MGSEIYSGPNRALAASKVNAPAIALMVVGGLGILWHLFFLGIRILGTGASFLSVPGMGQDDTAARVVSVMGGGIGIVLSVLGLGISGFVIWGAMKMRALTGYGIALASAILAMIPGFTCYCCCLGLPGLPFGIWALVVLLDNNVKQSFTG